MELHQTKPKYLIIFLLFLTINPLTAEEKKDTLSHIVIGHMCLFDGTIAERFEINYEKNNLYRLTIHANYLHIKGGKYRYKMKTSKKEWLQLNNLARKLTTACRGKTFQEPNMAYFVSYYTNGKVETERNFSDTNVPPELIEILSFIREKK